MRNFAQMLAHISAEVIRAQVFSRSAFMQSILDIETKRKAWRISKAELCRAAGVHVETYRRLMLGRTSPTMRTLARIERALEALTAPLRGAA